MKVALFLGAGASAFASQPTTQELMKLVRDRVQKNIDHPHRDDTTQNYIMRVVNDDAYSDVEKLYDGIERTIDTNGNDNCKPIVCNLDDHDYQISYTRITEELANLRSIIRKILRASFVIDPNIHNSIRQMYDMVLSFIKDSGTQEFLVFTTNYDLVMETYSEGAGLEVINGFRIFPYRKWVWTNKWDQDTDQPPLYLTKMHGSIYWHKDANDKIVETGSVADVGADSDIMIAPTEGAKNYSREPFSSLIDRFRTAIRDIDILLVIGFSYRDNEIVDIIKDGLKNGMALISISPDATTSIRSVSNAAIETINANGRTLNAIGSQVVLYEQKFGPDTIDDVRAALDAAYVSIRLHHMHSGRK